jgi:hypothetical protein
MLRRVGVENIGYVQFCDTDGTLRDGGISRHLACGDGALTRRRTAVKTTTSDIPRPQHPKRRGAFASRRTPKMVAS